MTARVDRGVLEAATTYLAAGLSVLPIKCDGTKSPEVSTLEGWVWKPLQSRRFEVGEVETHFSGGVGVGIIAGAISGGLEVIDFDRPGIFKEWIALLGDVDPELAARIDRGDFPLVMTPREGGGEHLYVRSDEGEPSQKLAMPASGDKPLIETKGEGGYVVAPGSPPACHETGVAYRLIKGRFESIGRVSAEERETLLRCAMSLDESGELGPSAGRGASAPAHALGGRPGDEFNERGDIEALLLGAGWTLAARRAEGVTHWRRPGKDHGMSATLGHCRTPAGIPMFRVFTTSTHLERKAYTPFALYVALEHGGDYSAAARACQRRNKKGPLRRLEKGPPVQGKPLAGVVTP